jgi:hypothetical protein
MRVFVSSASSTNQAQEIKDILHGEGAEVISAESANALPYIAGLNELAGIDAFIAVMSSGSSDGSLHVLLFEAGAAKAAGWPSLVIYERGFELPAPLLEFQGIGVDFSDIEPLRLQLRMFLKTLPHAETSQGSFSTRHLAEEYRRDLWLRLAKMQKTAPEFRGLQFERLVVELFKAGGALTIEPESGDTGIDAAVVFPGTERLLGPIVVEAKWAHHSSPQRMEDAERQLMTYVVERGARMGILIYDSAVPFPNLKSSPFVLVFWLPQLLERLDDGNSLVEIVVEARNRAVHGV